MNGHIDRSHLAESAIDLSSDTLVTRAFGPIIDHGPLAYKRWLKHRGCEPLRKLVLDTRLETVIVAGESARSSDAWKGRMRLRTTK